MQNDRIAELIYKYTEGLSTPEENVELEIWIQGHSSRREFVNSFTTDKELNREEYINTYPDAIKLTQMRMKLHRIVKG